jgi:hypothetical protein
MLPTSAIYTKSELCDDFVGQLQRDCPVASTPRKEIKERFNVEKIKFVARKAFLFISAKASMALQFFQVIPFGAIVAPIMELGRSIDFLYDSIRDHVLLNQFRHSLRTGELHQEVKELCLEKLNQDKLASWESIAENIGFVSLGIIRVAVIAAVITATISVGASGIALPVILGVGIGMIVVANLIKFGIELYQRPNTTRQTLKGNGIKLQWSSIVVLNYRKYKLERERKRLAEKYKNTSENDLTFEEINADMKIYQFRKDQVEEVKTRVKALNKAFRKAGGKDFALLQQRKAVNKKGKPLPDAPVVEKSYVKAFSPKMFRRFSDTEKKAFIEVFKVNPDRVTEKEYMKVTLKKWFSGFSRNDMIDRLDLGRRLMVLSS